MRIWGNDSSKCFFFVCYRIYNADLVMRDVLDIGVVVVVVVFVFFNLNPSRAGFRPLVRIGVAAG